MYIMPYLTPYNYKFNQVHDLLLHRILTRGRPIEFDGNYIVFELDDRFIRVWKDNRWYAYASLIYEVKKVKEGQREFWVPVNPNAMWGNEWRPRRKTLIAFDRMVKIFGEVQKENGRKVIDVES